MVCLTGFRVHNSIETAWVKVIISLVIASANGFVFILLVLIQISVLRLTLAVKASYYTDWGISFGF